MIIHMNVSDIPVINERLQHTPPQQVFLEVDNDICPLNIVKRFITLLLYFINRSDNGLFVNGDVLNSTILHLHVIPELSASFSKHGTSQCG